MGVTWEPEDVACLLPHFEMADQTEFVLLHLVVHVCWDHTCNFRPLKGSSSCNDVKSFNCSVCVHPLLSFNLQPPPCPDARPWWIPWSPAMPQFSWEPLQEGRLSETQGLIWHNNLKYSRQEKFFVKSLWQFKLNSFDQTFKLLNFELIWTSGDLWIIKCTTAGAWAFSFLLESHWEEVADMRRRPERGHQSPGPPAWLEAKPGE